MTYITASLDTLFEQSMDSGKAYMWAAKRLLDDAEIPYTASDVVALCRVMAEDYRSAAIVVAAQMIEQGLSEITQNLTEKSDEGVC